MRLLALCSAFALALIGCEKITVRECDDASHDDAAENEDGGLSNKDGSTTDSGIEPDAGSDPDSSMPQEDGGNPGCAAGGYCIEALVPSIDTANVREAVTFTPTVRAAGMTLTFSGDVSEIVATRRAPLPPVDLSDLELTFAVDPTTGAVEFLLSEVPTYFSTTTFKVRLHASAAGGPDVFAEASVTVRGNVLLSGTNDVFAIASDGAPALSANFAQGRLLSGASFVDEPEDLLLARDGTLIVYDDGSTPPRLRRFALDGENSQLPDFQFEVAATPIITEGNTGIGLTQLSDGRIVFVDYEYIRNQESMIHVWNEDGSFSHSFNAPSPTVDWSGAAGDDMGRLFVIERQTSGRLVEIDPDTGFELGVVTTDISFGYNLVWLPGGAFYVGLTGSVLRVSPQGGKQMVSGLPATSDTYRHLSAFGPARVITARGTSSDFSNVLIIENTDYERFFRREGVGAPVLSPYGLAFLD